MQLKELIIYNWQDIEYISKAMTKNIIKNNIPDVVIGISRGGNCIATIISEMLRRNMFTLCVTRRRNDVEVRKKPKIITSIPKKLIKNKSIVLIDEIVVTGETIDMAKKYLLKLGATKVKTYVIANRSLGKYKCDYEYIKTKNNNVIFPWDYLVLNEKKQFIVHPEYKEICEDLKVDLK